MPSIYVQTSNGRGFVVAQNKEDDPAPGVVRCLARVPTDVLIEIVELVGQAQFAHYIVKCLRGDDVTLASLVGDMFRQVRPGRTIQDVHDDDSAGYGPGVRDDIAPDTLPVEITTRSPEAPITTRSKDAWDDLHEKVDGYTYARHGTTGGGISVVLADDDGHEHTLYLSCQYPKIVQNLVQMYPSALGNLLPQLSPDHAGSDVCTIRFENLALSLVSYVVVKRVTKELPLVLFTPM